MLKTILKKFVSDKSKLLLIYHNIKSYLFAFLYGFPTRNMYVVAVTGTNGKTSTCNLLYQAYKHLGVSVSMLSTVNYSICGDEYDNKHKMSTLPASKLFSLLRKMKKAQTEVLIIEATSHAAVQGRLNGIKFDQLIFTNLGEDHLEYHGGFKAYKNAKILLTKKLKKDSVFIYNSFDDHSMDFVSQIKSESLSFGYDVTDTIRLQSFDLSLKGSSFNIVFKDKEYDLTTQVLGLYNILNIMAVLISLNVYNNNFQKNLDVVSKLKPVPGRLDVLQSKNNTFIFDYAHDTSGLYNLLSFVSEQKSGRLILLFGCVGGGRDKSKRPLMGEVASKFADYIFITNDDPYWEDPEEIISHILAGMHAESLKKVTKIVDREKAIRAAVKFLKPNDVLVLAGKGGEKVIVLGDKKIDFDEKEIVSDLISNHGS